MFFGQKYSLVKETNIEILCLKIENSIFIFLVENKFQNWYFQYNWLFNNDTCSCKKKWHLL